MPRLILINGAPGSGKSTLAERVADQSRFSLVLDIDTIRGQLGRWRDDPFEAGLAARRLALAMIATHLESGLDVIVPQFLRRAEFIVQLEAAASKASCRLVEVALVSDAREAAERFRARAGSPEANHADAAYLQSRAHAESIEHMYDDMIVMLRERENTAYVESTPGAIDATLQRLLDAIGAADPSGSGRPYSPQP